PAAPKMRATECVLKTSAGFPSPGWAPSETCSVVCAEKITALDAASVRLLHPSRECRREGGSEAVQTTGPAASRADRAPARGRSLLRRHPVFEEVDMP